MFSSSSSKGRSSSPFGMDMSETVKCGCAYFSCFDVNVDLDMAFLPASLVAFLRSPLSYIKIWLVYWFLDILATGPMPRHIAFVMDGNRRYARRLGKQGKEGHPDGFQNLLWVGIYCRQGPRTLMFARLGPRALPTATYPMCDCIRICDRKL